MKNFLITFLFFIFVTNNILFAQECLEGDCTDGSGKKKVLSGDFKDRLLFKTNGVYTGGFKNGKFHGEGTYLIEDWGVEFDKLTDHRNFTKVEYIFNEGDIIKAVYYEKGGFKFENAYEGRDDSGYAKLKYGSFYFGDKRLKASFKDNVPYGKASVTNEIAGKFDIYIQEGTFVSPCPTNPNDVNPNFHGEVTVTYRDGKKYENIYECGARSKGTIFLETGSKLEGTFKITDLGNGKKEEALYDGLKTYPDGRKVKYKEGKAMTLSVVVQDNQNNKEETDEFVKIKNETINAINKAQSCYNSLGSIGQSQIRSNLVGAKTTFNDAKKLENQLKSMNGDVTQSAGVYQSATTQANVVVNLMCN